MQNLAAKRQFPSNKLRILISTSMSHLESFRSHIFQYQTYVNILKPKLLYIPSLKLPHLLLRNFTIVLVNYTVSAQFSL